MTDADSAADAATNFGVLADKKTMEQMINEMEKTPYGAEDWIYSNWNFKNAGVWSVPKFSAVWWF